MRPAPYDGDSSFWCSRGGLAGGSLGTMELSQDNPIYIAAYNAGVKQGLCEGHLLGRRTALAALLTALIRCTSISIVSMSRA